MRPTIPPITAEQVERYNDFVTAIEANMTSDKEMYAPDASDASSKAYQTPQQLALNWLTFTDTLNINKRVAPKEWMVQRYAVAVLYFSTQGNQWKKSTGWLTGTHECDWHGLQCEMREVVTSRNGLMAVKMEFMAVTEVRLQENNIFGIFPKEIVAFQFLKSLALFDNKFFGTLPTEIGNFAILEELWIDNNKFQGVLPSEIGLLGQLQQIDVFTNNFDGMLPSQVSIKGFPLCFCLSKADFSSFPSNSLQTLCLLYGTTYRIGNPVTYFQFHSLK